MKKLTTTILMVLILVSLTGATYSTNDPFVLFNFNDRKPMSSISGQSGIFDFDPDDAEAYCRVGYAQDEGLHKDGYHMKLSYDVNSAKPAFNGWWTKLNGIDLSKFEAISITIKGDAEKGFSDFFKIELKDKNRKIEYILEDVSDKWKQITIPFSEFEGDVTAMDWASMNEFVIVFEDWRMKTKEGRYLIDDIFFVPKKGEKVSLDEIIKRKK